VRSDNGAGTFSLYAAYPHGTLILPSADCRGMCRRSLCARVLQTWSGRCTTCTFVLVRPKPLPSLVTSHPAFSGDVIKRQMLAASMDLRPGDAVRLQVGSVKVGWRATVCGQDINVAGVVTLTLLELIDRTGVPNTHGAAPYHAAPLYNVAFFKSSEVHTGVTAARQAPSQSSSENLAKRNMALVYYGSSN
jgi:hypothetical protein